MEYRSAFNDITLNGSDYRISQVLKDYVEYRLEKSRQTDRYIYENAPRALSGIHPWRYVWGVLYLYLFLCKSKRSDVYYMMAQGHFEDIDFEFMAHAFRRLVSQYDVDRLIFLIEIFNKIFKYDKAYAQIIESTLARVHAVWEIDDIKSVLCACDTSHLDYTVILYETIKANRMDTLRFLRSSGTFRGLSFDRRPMIQAVAQSGSMSMVKWAEECIFPGVRITALIQEHRGSKDKYAQLLCEYLDDVGLHKEMLRILKKEAAKKGWIHIKEFREKIAIDLARTAAHNGNLKAACVYLRECIGNVSEIVSRIISCGSIEEVRYIVHDLRVPCDVSCVSSAMLNDDIEVFKCVFSKVRRLPGSSNKVSRWIEALILRECV